MDKVLDGKKIPDEYENFFDIIVIKISQFLNINLFRPLNFTPNMITTLSLVFGLLSAYFLYNRLYFISTGLFLISYLFDCCDGNYARMFNMTTKFGDLYDHITDFIKTGSISIIILLSTHIPWNIKIIYFTFGAILLLLTNIHLGCQEKLYNTDESPTLSIFKKLCIGDAIINIKFTKYFGVGTIILFISGFIASLAFIDKK